MSAMKQKSDHLEGRLKEQLAKAVSLEKEVSTLSMYLQQKTSYASSIESELESKRAAIEALKAKMESNQKKFEHKCEEYESQLGTSHQETQDERDRAVALEQELEGARADFEDLNGQLDQMEQKNQHTEEQLNTLREELLGVKTSTSTEILQLDEKLNVVRVECNQLKDSKQSLENELKERMVAIQELTSARTSLQSELAAVQQELADGRHNWSSERAGLQEDNETLKKQKDEISYLFSVAQENETKLSSDLSRLESDMNDEKVMYSKKIATLEEALVAKHKSLEQLQQEKVAFTEKHLTEQKALVNNLSNIRTQLEGSKAKVQNLEAMVTKHTSTIAELERKTRSLEGERNALLEKVVSEEEKTHKLSEENGVLSRSVKELTSGLQDLAREHQMLQVFHTRQRDKRWEKDDEVEHCTSCASKFSVANRRPHLLQ